MSSNQVLNSWKEISTYLNRGVRTVQRWESELGLPVRRPRGKSRSAVIAIRSELDQWLRNCPLTARRESEVTTFRVNELVNTNGLALGGGQHKQTEARSVLSDLLLRSRLLRGQLDGSVKELWGALDLLVANMQTLAQSSYPGPVGAAKETETVPQSESVA